MKWIRRGSLLLPFFVVIGVIFALVGTFGNSDYDELCVDWTGPAIENKDAEANAKAIYDYVGSHVKGATPQGLAGMLGNFEQECSLNPSAVERQHDPLSGHGIAQWTAGRTTNLMNFAKEKGKEWHNLGLQLEFLVHELNSSENAAQKALKVTDVQEATDQWQLLFERAGEPAIQNRRTFANKWYAKLGSSDPASSIVGNTAVGGQQSELDILCAGESGAPDSDVLKAAKKYIGWFHYPNPIAHNLAMIGGDPRKPDKEGRTDCSGLVWLALENAGCKVPPDIGWFTGSMSADARGAHQWLKAISESEATAGDVVIVNLGAGAGANGHTAIIAEKWHGADTKIVQMGGNGDITNEDTFQRSFLSLLSGGDVCFARPIKK